VAQETEIQETQKLVPPKEKVLTAQAEQTVLIEVEVLLYPCPGMQLEQNPVRLTQEVQLVEHARQTEVAPKE